MEKKEVADYGPPPRETMILEEYREKHATYEKLLEVVKKILTDSIAANNIYINAVEARIKAEDSLAGKLERKAGKYRSLITLRGRIFGLYLFCIRYICPLCIVLIFLHQFGVI